MYGCCVFFTFIHACTIVQLLNTDVVCPKYIEELLKVYLSRPVQEVEQQNEVSHILFQLIYV